MADGSTGPGPEAAITPRDVQTAESLREQSGSIPSATPENVAQQRTALDQEDQLNRQRQVNAAAPSTSVESPQAKGPFSFITNFFRKSS
jgi:hypothetical protein